MVEARMTKAQVFTEIVFHARIFRENNPGGRGACPGVGGGGALMRFVYHSVIRY